MTMIFLFIIHTIAFGIGVFLVYRTILTALRVFLLPRGARDRLAAIFFVAWRKVFYWRVNRSNTYEDRDRIMAMFAPIALLSLPGFMLALIALGYTLIYWAVGVGDFYESFALSGSSLLTLGFAREEGFGLLLLQFSEAAMGPTLAALLISYLPTMYAAFSVRETAVTLLEVRAGWPPSAVEMIGRSHRIRGLDYLTEIWEQWEHWFAALEESHTSLAALVFFRSPKPNRSWVTAAGTVLDCAALYSSTLNRPRDPQAELCIRAGFLALRSIADFYRIKYDPDPAPTDPISISRAEFDDAYRRMQEYGVPLKPDMDQCWRDFSGWRVNYDAVLLQLSTLTMAPYAPWISDRSLLPSAKSVAKRRSQETQAKK
ncbi:MAG: hypothetical protein HY866_05525 [Chloroflexi bacterium]|nr:hypothetical protein [Chloroflexota bacterium]